MDEGANTSVVALGRIQVAQALRKEYPQRYQEDFNNFNAALAASQQASSGLETFRGQISDSTLDKLIEEAQKAQEDASLEMLRLAKLLNEGNESIETQETAFANYKGVINNLRRGKLIAVNKRIEELLSGEPPL